MHLSIGTIPAFCMGCLPRVNEGQRGTTTVSLRIERRRVDKKVVISLPRFAQHPLDSLFGHTIYRVYRLCIGISQKTQTRHSKACMPHIYHIAWPVRNPPILLVLASQNKPDQRFTVNPVCTANDLQTAQHPPAITYILGLFRTTVEPAAGDLPLAQPPAQLVDIDKIQSACNGEGCNACENLA